MATIEIWQLEKRILKDAIEVGNSTLANDLARSSLAVARTPGTIAWFAPRVNMVGK